MRNVTDWQYLNLNYTAKARIDQEVFIKCGRCYAACEDTFHQSAGVVRRAPSTRARVVESRLRLGRPRYSMPLSLVRYSWPVDVPLTIPLRGLLAAQRWLLGT